jgi:hypothetical protein
MNVTVLEEINAQSNTDKFCVSKTNKGISSSGAQHSVSVDLYQHRLVGKKSIVRWELYCQL